MIRSSLHSSGASDPLWLDRHPRQPGPSLTRDAAADVCVVGGGIAGLTTAYLLAEAGRSVALLEDGMIGSGETGRTTAHLSDVLDDRFQELERLHGADGARLAFESHHAAIAEIERLATTLKIACAFERLPGYLFPAAGGEGRLEEEFEAARRAGHRSARLLSSSPLPSWAARRCIEFPDQAQFDPIAYLTGLAEAFVDAGGRLFERTRMESIEEEEEEVVVRTGGGHAVRAQAAVIATNAPVTSPVSVPLRQAAYRTYAAALPLAPGLRRALWWDMEDPYHYVRLHETLDGRAFLIVGGEDHKTGQGDDPDERWKRLADWARERFPGAGEPAYRWSGQVMEPVDGLAFIGRQSKDGRIYIATGDSGHGMTHGTIAGLLLRDLVQGGSHPWAELYDPHRLRWKSIPELLRENANVVPRYGDWLTPGEIPGTADLPVGQGAVVREGLRKVACYRDEKGLLHAFSARCPHLGCIVRWNGAEKTWDCPCHGSRFTCFGRVVNGPANADLEPTDLRQEAVGE
ncbi:MAG TPA: FAD-dependent oxidoreductase [Planctomycetota bacterium]|nr:FAD-dependent oxidoreductase [Planctomycetota bacterium]